MKKALVLSVVGLLSLASSAFAGGPYDRGYPGRSYYNEPRRVIVERPRYVEVQQPRYVIYRDNYCAPAPVVYAPIACAPAVPVCAQPPYVPVYYQPAPVYRQAPTFSFSFGFRY